jgi:hypothetical protein
MKLKSNQPKATAEQVVKDIRRATRRHYSTRKHHIQVDKPKLEIPELNILGLNSMGVLSPRLIGNLYFNLINPMLHLELEITYLLKCLFSKLIYSKNSIFYILY